jgi:methylglutaconyl-CoA hydratase
MKKFSSGKKSIGLTTRKFTKNTFKFNVECSLSQMEHKKGISVISLNRPKAKNSLGRQLVGEFQQILRDLRYEQATNRVVIIKSEVNGVFCVGADLKERSAMSLKESAIFVDSLRSLFNDVETLPMPTIACISGFALGGGMELALACDMRVADSSAVLGLPETSLGIIPGAGGTQRLPRIVGIAKAKELIFTARKIDLKEAKAIGLVNIAVENNPYEKALELAEEIVSNGPIALKVAKIAINQGVEMSKQDGFILEQQCYAQILPSKDRLEGLNAFKEKRKPVYTGE